MSQSKKGISVYTFTFLVVIIVGLVEYIFWDKEKVLLVSFLAYENAIDSNGNSISTDLLDSTRRAYVSGIKIWGRTDSIVQTESSKFKRDSVNLSPHKTKMIKDVSLLNAKATSSGNLSNSEMVEIANRFIIKGDVIIDKANGLMWVKDEFKKQSWYDAYKYTKALKLSGYNDWKLPTIDELNELQFEADGQAIRRNLFPDFRPSPYWCLESCPIINSLQDCLTKFSNDPYSCDVAYALTFGNGPSGTYDKNAKISFKPVRKMIN